jgi:redox-sensitive bicupin YhaK (pirin superfamily)
MTAGRGIVHSERSPEELRTEPLPISGLQTWLALPDHLEEIDPTFANTGAAELPTLQESGMQARVVMGEFHSASSRVKQHAETLYVDIRLKPGSHIQIPANAAEERAIYTLDGSVEIAGQGFPADRLLAFRNGDEIVISAPQGAHFMLFGGATLPSKRYIWWNFVSSSKERIEQAKEEWRTGRFDIVPGDEAEFIPLPEN